MARRKSPRVRRYAHPRGGFSTRIRLFRNVFVFYVREKAPKEHPSFPAYGSGRGWRAKRMRSARGERA